MVYGEKTECKEKTSMETNDNYYTNDDGLNYYSCSDIRYNSVVNCNTCNDKDTCKSCKSGYILFNSNKLCVTNDELLNNKYYQIEGNFYLCSEKLKGCERCINENTCIECNIAYDLEENNKCIPTALAMTKYYLDETTKKYISCSKIENCDECISSTECTSCKSGYEIKNSLCKKNDNSLTIAALILAIFAIIISIIAIILIFLKKILFKNTITQNNDSVNSIKINNEEIVIQTTKRSIHNDPKK